MKSIIPLIFASGVLSLAFTPNAVALETNFVSNCYPPNLEYGSTVGENCNLGFFTQYPDSEITSSVTGDIPPGMSLKTCEFESSTFKTYCQFSGVLEKAGVYNFTVALTASDGSTSQKSVTLPVFNPIEFSDEDGKKFDIEVGKYFEHQINVTGGQLSHLNLIAGGLPPGLLFDHASKLISGTPTSAGSFNSYIHAYDQARSVANFYDFSVKESVVISIDDAALVATVNQPFSHTFSASGGKPPYSFEKHTGVLPSGLTLNGDTLSGTPTSVNSHQFELRVTDADGVSANKTFDIEVKADMRPPVADDFTLNVTSRDSGVWVPFDVRDHITNFGDPASQFNLKNSSPGVTLDVYGLGGQIFVPISAVGSAQVQYTVSNPSTGVESNVATITINLADPVVSIVDVQNGTAVIGQAFQARYNAQGAASPYTYSISGDVPPGLTWSEINNSGGLATYELSGTPTTGGVYNFTLNVADLNGFTASKSFSMDLGIPLTVSDANVSVQYGQSVSVDLKDYISGNYSDLQIPTDQTHGTVTVSDTIVTYSTPASDGEFVSTERIDYTVRNPNGNLEYGSINITVDAPARMTVSSPNLSVDRETPISFDLNDYVTVGYFDLDSVGVTQFPASGILSDLGGGKYSYSPNSNELNAETITLPFSAYERNFGPVNGTVTIEVAAKKVISLQGALITGKVGNPISHKIVINGGVAPSVIGPIMGMPAWLTINGDVLEGTPTADGTFTILLGVRDSEGTMGTGVFRLEIAPADAVIDLPAQTFSGKVGIEFPAVTISATGGEAPYSYTVKSGALPADLTFTNGELSGTPTAEGTFTFEVEATDAKGISGVGNFTVEIAPADAPVVIDLPNLTMATKVGEAFSQAIDATGGDAPYSFSITSGTLPDGLALNGNVIEGTAVVDGTFSVTVQATDANGVQASKPYDIVVAPADVVVEVTLPALSLTGKVGDEFKQQFAADGGSAPYAFAVVDALPDGLTLVDDTVSGIPTTEGDFTFEMSATDVNGEVGTQKYTMTVATADIVVSLPTASDGSLKLEYGQSGEISLSGLVDGDVDTISIVSQPTKGTVKFDGSNATYVPNEGATGSDKFTFTATNSAGSVSGTVTVTISSPVIVGDVPVAQNHTVRLAPLESGSVVMTTGAVSHDPILKAHVLSSVAAHEGSTKIFDKEIKFAPHKAFAGQSVVSYQLENRWGRSNVATITFIVAPRPDPSEDPEVIGLLTSQVQDAKALANDQEASLTRRNEAIRSEVDGERTSSISWTVGMDRRHEGDRDADGNLNEEKDRETIRSEFKSHEPFAIWTDGYVRIGENEFGGADFKSTAIGFTAGADYRFNPNFVGGVALGYGRQVTDIGSNGTRNEATAITGALYGTWHNAGGAFIDGVIGYQSVKMDSKRFVTANEQFAYGSRDGDQVFGSLVAGYQFKNDGLTIEPYAGVRAVIGQLSSFSETGGDHYGLSYGTTDVRSFSGVAGVRVEKQFDLDTFTITPSAKLEYRHEFADASLTAVGYTDLGTLPYLVRTEEKSRNSVAATVGVKVKPKDTNLTLEANVQATKSASSKSVSVSVKATYEICAFGAKEGDCLSREDKISYFKAELEKAKKAKNKARIAEVKKRLKDAEAALAEWKTLSKNAKPLPDLMYVDTISGRPGKR